MGAYYNNRRRWQNSRSIGYERAKQHIEEARKLSLELGGTDRDVKQYFFALSDSELTSVLDEYGMRYGGAARQYAVQTLPQWRSGRVQMSGQNAARLFKLLPRRMPLEKKYALVESLWQKHAPRSAYSIAVGVNCAVEDVHQCLASHLDSVVQSYSVPEVLQRRFDWLSDGDAVCCQQLLNHFLMRDRDLAVQAVIAQWEVLQKHLSVVDNPIQSYRRDIRVGGHEVEIYYDPKAEKVTIVRGRRPPLMRIDAGYVARSYRSASGRSLIDKLIPAFVCLIILGPFILPLLLRLFR